MNTIHHQSGSSTLRRRTAQMAVLLGGALFATLSIPAWAVNLVHYDFSNGSGSTVTDLSGLGNHGTVTNFTNTSAGGGVFNVTEGWVSGGGLSMLEDNHRSFVETSLALNSVAGKSFTVEYLASNDTPVGWSPAVGSNTPTFADGDNVFFTGIADGGIAYEIRLPDGTSPGAGNAGQLPGIPQPWRKSFTSPDPTPHHIAMTYTLATDTVELFFDNVSQGTRTTDFGLDPTLASAASKFRIGNVGFDPNQQWDGIYSGVAISTSALNPGSFALTNGSQASTQLLYDFSDGSGTTVTNLAASGSANDGTLVGFASTSAGAGSFNATEGWVSGGGLSVIDDLTRSYVETPLSINALTTDFTIEATVNYSNPSGFAPIIGTSASVFSTNDIMFLGTDPAERSLGINMPGTWSDNTLVDHPWFAPVEGLGELTHHVAIVFDQPTGQTSLFYDGQFIGNVNTPTTDMDSTALFRLGNVGYSSVDEWDGVFYGFAVSDEALAAADFVLPVPEPTADFDGDGDVDGRDFLEWQRGNGLLPTGKPRRKDGDANLDASVNAADLAIWIDKFGVPIPAVSASTSVPEPTSALLALIAVMFGATQRRC